MRWLLHCNKEQLVLYGTQNLEAPSSPKENLDRNMVKNLNASALSNKSIKKWCEKFKSTGTVENCKVHQPTVLNTQAILDLYIENPKTSLRRCANLFGISHGSVRNTLKKSKFHPYKLKIVQELNANDYATKMTFAEEMIDKILHSQDFLCHLMFSDEAHFHLHGGVNTHNCRYWSNTNPHWTAEKPLHSPRTTVWAAIWDGGIIGPIFLDTNVNGDNYLHMLQSRAFGQPFQHYQIMINSFSCKTELLRIGLQL